MGLTFEFILIIALVLNVYNSVVSEMNSNVKRYANNVTTDIRMPMYTTMILNKMSPIR